MEKALIREIKENILTNNPSFVKAYSTLRQSVSGKVIQWTNDEGEIIGLRDNLYNYFYIRYIEEPTLDTPTDRTTSCHEYELTTKLRLVAWVNHGNEAKLKEVLIYDLVTTDIFFNLDHYEKRRVTKVYPIQIDEIFADKERIFSEETGQPLIKLRKGVTLVAVDFTLRFNYKPYVYPDLCLDREICEVC